MSDAAPPSTEERDRDAEPDRPSALPQAQAPDGARGWRGFIGPGSMLRSRLHQIAAGLVFVIAGAIGFIPLFGGPGYESALAFGIVLPSIVAVISALDLGRERRQPFDGFCRGVGTGAALFGVALLTSIVHGLRVGLCDPWTGLENVLLGPGAGSLLAGAWGWTVAEIAGGVRRRGLRVAALVALALAAPLGCIVVSLGRFYTSPMIFAFDPFVGYFSGSIYDTVLDLTPLLSYRAGTAATLFAAFVFALHLTHDERGRLHYESIGRPGLLALGVASAIASLTITAKGSKLGHYQTRGTIEEALGAVIHGDRCDVVYPRSLAVDQAQRFLGECDGYVEANEAWLGITGTPRITAFLFESESQKASLMGAAGTNIAKPWRHEVYVQVSAYPHRVIGHEVMHVVAGGIGHGPFRIAGSLGGLLPNPGLIEGVAVASNPKDDDLGPAEWARAMKDLGILPKLSKLFALGFLGENASTAYTVSGAFVGWIHDTYGAKAIVDWYGGAELPAVVGKSWDTLETEWHASLDALVVPDAAAAVAKARFDRPAIFGRKCPRVVDECKERSDSLAGAGDARGAIAALDEVLALDPRDDDTRLNQARLWIPAGDVPKARALLGAMVDDEKLRRGLRDAAIEELADLDLSEGNGPAALARYRDLLTRTLDESKIRTLYVKSYGATDATYRDAIVTLLIGTPGKKPSRTRATELLAALDVEHPENGLAAYLLARYHVDNAEFDVAAALLDRALARKLDVPHVRVEALRLRAVTACARGEIDVAARILGEYEKDPAVLPARKETLARLVDRSRRQKERADARANQ
ncbi:MAG: tetratricopeptide repeat protein [Polyangiaceae bacterium]